MVTYVSCLRAYGCALLCLLAAFLLASCTDDARKGEIGFPSTGGQQGDSLTGPASAAVGNGMKQQAIARMQQAIVQYERVEGLGGWPAIPYGETIEPGDSSARIILLRELLTKTGDLTGTATQESGRIYTPTLVQAVMQFQARHGLEADGRIGSTTLAAMNTPVEQRLEQLRINLNRLQELPDSMGQRFVLVNIPEYKLRAYENDAAVQEMAVIVGETYEDQQTPRFSDEMEYIIFRPYWNVPERIAAEEIVPEARLDPTYLSANNYEITSDWGPDAEVMEVTPENLDLVEAGTLKIRQKPGEENALGLVKFMFPNPYDVYLHGTPADYLFGEQTRAFSHGCIRVEKPVELAQFLLLDQPDWSRERIEQAMHGGEQTRVDLSRPTPIHIVYLTAFVDNEGKVHFFEDVYNLQGDGQPRTGDQRMPEDPNAMDPGR